MTPHMTSLAKMRNGGWFRGLWLTEMGMDK